MFQGWHAPFCQIALNCWEISSSVVNLLIGLLETDVPRHGCTKGNYDPKLWRTLLPGGRGHSPNINMILNNTFHKLAFAKRNKNILWNAVSLWWTEGLAYFLGGDQPKNKLGIVIKKNQVCLLLPCLFPLHCQYHFFVDVIVMVPLVILHGTSERLLCMIWPVTYHPFACVSKQWAIYTLCLKTLQL